MSLVIGRVLRDEGIERVTRNGPAFHAVALGVFMDWYAKAAPGDIYTANILKKEYRLDPTRPEPHDENCWGGVFSAVARKRLMARLPDDYEQAEDDASHARRVTVWVKVDPNMTTEETLGKTISNLRRELRQAKRDLAEVEDEWSRWADRLKGWIRKMVPYLRGFDTACPSTWRAICKCLKL
jgi:hypothetical protein